MESQNSFDNFEGPLLWDLDNTMPFDENGPASLAGVDFPDWTEDSGHQSIDPRLWQNSNFASNPQATTAGPPFDLGAAMAPAQGMNSHTPFANPGMGYLPSPGYGYLAGQPTPPPSQALHYVPQAGTVWAAQIPNQAPFQPFSQHTQSHAQQGARQRGPQTVQRHPRGHVVQGGQHPGPQYTAQQTQQRVPGYGRQPEPQVVSADLLRQRLKEPSTDEFKSSITTFQEAEQWERVYLSLGDMAGKSWENIQGREKELVGRLYRAIRHVDHVDGGVSEEMEDSAAGPAGTAADGPSPKKRKRASAGGQSEAAILRLRPIEVELVCWQLLVRRPVPRRWDLHANISPSRPSSAPRRGKTGSRRGTRRNPPATAVSTASTVASKRSNGFSRCVARRRPRPAG